MPQSSESTGMSDTIIQRVDGKELESETHTCKFCEEKATTLFGVINLKDKRYNGLVLKSFPICSKHMRALNSLLDGSKDIDGLVRNYDRIAKGGKFNLRAFI